MIPSGAAVELTPDAEQNGLAVMISGLIAQNLQDRPQLQRDFKRLHGRVAMVVVDAGVSMTLHFQRGQLQVFDGIMGMPHLTLVSDSDTLLSLSRIEHGAFGLPDLQGENLRKVARALYTGQLRVYGALRHGMLLRRLSGLLAIH